MPVAAENAAVTLGVGDTILAVQGKTSPLAFVTISRDGSVIGTTSADTDGVFSQTFPAQTPGLHQIGVWANTTGGIDTDTITVDANISEHGTSTVAVFLPSTLIIADSDLDHDQPLALSGETSPSSQATIYIDGSTYATASTDSQGLWQTNVTTTGLASGSHTVFVKITDQFGTQSYSSSLRSFTIAASPMSPPPVILLPPGNTPNVPIITFPPVGLEWTSPNITVRGTADPYVQIELFDDKQSLSSVFADRYGQWFINLQLTPKDYSLHARACREGICSGFSLPLPFKVQHGDQVLTIQLQKTAFVVERGKPLSIDGLIVNGRPLYTVIVNWGNNNQTLTQDTREIHLEHTYNESGHRLGWVDITDTNGLHGQVLFSVEVVEPSLIIPVAVSVLGISLLYVLSRFAHHRRLRHKQSK